MSFEIAVWFNIKEIRGLLFLQMLSFLVFSCGYVAGFGQLRYSDNVEPLRHFEGWAFLLGIALPIINMVSTFFCVINNASRNRPSGFLIYPCVFIAIAQTFWSFFLMCMNLPVWVNCNDGGLVAPAHPECINRKYPLETLPDWTFMIQIIASGGLGASGILSLLSYYNTNLQILAATNMGIASSISGKRRKQKKHSNHTRANESHFSGKSRL